ncbi:MAG: hypothetical protein MZV70_00790 [Desulfobacterales bacterium]|nr:hypothetical protein [Desulfobacterales bacterium]
MRWSDDATTRLGTCTDWVNLLNNEVNAYYKRGDIQPDEFHFRDVPCPAPGTTWGYASASYDFFKTGQDAISLIDPHDVNMANYDRVLVITNWDGFLAARGRSLVVEG